MDHLVHDQTHDTLFDGDIDGHRLTVIVEGAARFDRIVTRIKGATESLRLFYYIFSGDAHGVQVRDALIDACGRGVKVSLMIDGFGSENLADTFFAPLISAGAHFERFLPRYGRRYLLRNHQKMLIVDGTQALIGGANIATDYFVEPERGSQWHDMMLAIEGPAAARLAAYYDDLAIWVSSEKNKIASLQRILLRHSDTKGPLRWLHGGPFRRHSPLSRVLRDDLDDAHVVDLIEAYFSPNWPFLRRLHRIAKHGRLRILTAAKSDNATTVGAARHCYPGLLKRRALIYEYTLTKLHMKLIIIDDVVYIGSANFDTRSLYINVELMLRIESAPFARMMRHFCSGQHAMSQQMDATLLKRIAGPFRRLRWMIAYFIVSTVDYTISRRLNIQPNRRTPR